MPTLVDDFVEHHAHVVKAAAGKAHSAVVTKQVAATACRRRAPSHDTHAGDHAGRPDGGRRGVNAYVASL